MSTIAIIGASRDASKISNRAVRDFKAAGWKVYPVNPHTKEILGIKTFSKLANIGTLLDVVTMYVPPVVGKQLLTEIKEHSPEALVIFNPGSSDAEVLQEAKRLSIRYEELCSLTHLAQLTDQFSG